MLAFKFKYLSKPSKEYTLEYGLENKPRPYFFNHPAGLNSGRYRFDYDRRDRVHIEDDEAILVKWARDLEINEEGLFVKWPRDIDINKESMFVKWAGDMEISKRLALVKWARSLEINKLYSLEKQIRELGKSKDITLEKKVREILEENEVNLRTPAKEILIDFEYEFKRKVQELFLENKQMDLAQEIKELAEEAGENHFETKEKEVNIESGSSGLIRLLQELYKDSHRNTLTTMQKGLERENGKPISRAGTFEVELKGFDKLIDEIDKELEKEGVLEGLYFNLAREIIDNTDLKLHNNIFKDLDISGELENDGGFILFKELKELVLYSTVSFFKEALDFDIEKGDMPKFKKLNEIYKHHTPVENVLFLYSIYDALIEKDFIQVEAKEELLKIFKGKMLEKDFTVDLETQDTLKKLVGNFKYDLFQEIQEKLLEILPNKELYLEDDFKEMEEVYEIIIHLEKGLRKLDKQDIKDLYMEEDERRLIKRLVTHDLVTEEEGERLEKSYIGKILLEEMLGIDRLAVVREIVKEKESLPMAKSFREILIDKTDLGAIKEAIEIDVTKEKEFQKTVREVELEGDEERIKFNKRFWFLRATDPFDLKILPFSDYPYSEKPLFFGNNLIPDNWQLDMAHVPRLYEEIKFHPIPWGSDLARTEMELSIEIMIDVINIMILIWSRMFYNFSGYTGSQAVIRFTKILYDWLFLETSLEQMEEKQSTEHYFRCYNWIRWEAEKVAIKARDDMSLSGNHYIDEWIFELIYYMENHHFDTMPIFEVVGKMDEYRALLPSDNPQGDIDFVLDKVKGMRHKIIEGRVKKNNE